MNRGFISSIVIHAAILLAVLVGLPSVKPFEPPQTEMITVDISNIASETKLKAQTKSAEKATEKPAPKAAENLEKTKPPEKVEPEKKLAKAEPAKAEPPPPTPEPKPEPKPEKVDPPPPDQNALNSLLEEEQKKAEEQRKKEEAKAKAEEKKKKADDAKKLADQKKAEADKKKKLAYAAKLDEMIDKLNTEQADTLEKKDTAGSPELAQQDVQGQDDALSATLADQMRQKLNQCWDKPPGSIGSEVKVVMSWRMDKDGNVVGQPTATGGTRENPFYDVTARSALSAIMQCQPFDFLPRDKFALWQEFDVLFDPR